MDVPSAIKSQYHAALKTVRDAIEKCPDAMWDAPDLASPPFWRVVYHTLYIAHFYLQQDQANFTPWARHRDEAQFISTFPGITIARPSRASLSHATKCSNTGGFAMTRLITESTDLTLSAPQCGFPWYQMPTLEHQIVNIRHIQNHAAALAMRLRLSSGIEVRWFGEG